MYEQFYGLDETPFSLTPDTDFYYQSLTHQQALDVLMVALQSGDGFIKLTGEVGTGKTLLCRKLLDMLDDRFETTYIPNPYMSCAALLRAVAAELGLSVKHGEDYLAAINNRVLEHARLGRQTVLLLDEAQSLPIESLEAIRLLSNLETGKRKLVQIVLFGQPELDRKLQSNNIRQLQQRISHACELQHLALDAVTEYITHRLSAAGYYGSTLFEPRAIRRLYKESRGIPRLINLLCHKSLMLAYATGEFHVSAKLVAQAARDTQQAGALVTSTGIGAGILAGAR